MKSLEKQTKDFRPTRAVAASFLPVRIQTIATSIKSTNSEGIFTIKTTAKTIPIMQVQTLQKRPPVRSKKDQARAINFQLHPRRRPSTPLKPEPQTPQVK